MDLPALLRELAGPLLAGSRDPHEQGVGQLKVLMPGLTAPEGSLPRALSESRMLIQMGQGSDISKAVPRRPY